MGSILRKVGVLATGTLLGVAAVIAAVTPTGVISAALRANVDGADAALGGNVYAGDSLETFDSGRLQLRVGAGQLFLLASSKASLTQDHALIDLLMQTGSAGFSATEADPLEIDTPVGTLRPANSSRAFGQATILGPRQILVTSYEGTLLLARNGETRLIEPGKSYRVTLADDADQAPQGGGGGGRKKKAAGAWIFDAVIVAGAGAGAYLLYHALSISPSAP